jgi:hypothetical protein
MPYELDVFKSWPTMSSWEELKNFLISEAGGLLRVVEPRDSAYALIRYKKGVSNFNLAHVPWCRSVVVHKDSRLPVCVSPVKSDVITDSSVNDATVAEELIDGTMLNVFHAAGDESVVVSTRGRLGADKSFYSGSPSFRSMLDEAMVSQGVNTFADMLPSNTSSLHRFTSTVLQHPANRIVKSIDTPSFAIVHQGWVTGDGSVFIEEDASEFNYVSSKETDNSEIQPYNIESVRSAKTVKDWVSTQAQTRGFGWQGLVLKDGKGRRWRQRSEVYETVRALRGNELTPGERYARLRKTRVVDQYLAFYSEDKQTLYDLEGLLRNNTRQLLNFYVDVFRSRKTLFHELPWPYKHHVSVLHNYYKNTLRNNNVKVDFTEVVKYVNNLSMEDTVNMLKKHNLELKKSTETVVPSSEPIVTV